MRARLESIALVESYLAGQLTGTERAQFESELSTDSVLQQLVAFQRDLQKAVVRKALRSQIQAAAKGGGFSGMSGKAWLIGGLIVLSGLIAYALFPSKPAEDAQPKTEEPSTTPTPAVTTGNGDTTALVAEQTRDTYQKGKVTTTDRFPSDPAGKEWQPWVPFKRQYFTIDPAKGSTIEGKSGTVIIVPSDAFVDKNGAVVTTPVKFELIEAIDLADMLAYNLTTMSFGKMLSSGGMIHNEAFSNGEQVEINPDRPLYIEIPANRYNPNMMAWKGVVKGEELNWEEPQPLKQFLTTVDFAQLDFKPNGFANAVTAYLPISNQSVNSAELTDSLYYALGSPETIASLTSPFTQLPKKSVKALEGFKGAIGEVADGNGNVLKDIEILFPEDADMANRTTEYSRENGRFPVDIYQRTAISLRLVKPGFDTIVTKPITFTPEKIARITADFRLTDAATLTSGTRQSAEELFACMIDPLAIKAIRTAEFSNTLLATKEFETRVQLLHKLKNGQELFDLYVNNLSDDLSTIDQRVADRLAGTDKSVFEQLAAQQLTNVQNASIHGGQLTAYYNQKRKEYRQENEAVHSAYLKNTQAELTALVSELQDLQADLAGNDPQKAKNRAARFAKKTPHAQTYATTWYTSGWMNIDVYLDALSAGTPKSVAVDLGSATAGSRIFQCVDLLKTIVPLTKENNGATALFPDASSPESADMQSTFCIGIDRQGGKVRYAEQRYNPYTTDNISLVWETISANALYGRLQTLSPTNDKLVGDLKQEENYLRELIAYREAQSAGQQKVRSILDGLERESSIMRLLLKFINPCYEIPPEPKAPNPPKQTPKSEGNVFETS